MAVRSVKPFPTEMWNQLIVNMKRGPTPEQIKKCDELRKSFKDDPINRGNY